MTFKLLGFVTHLAKNSVKVTPLVKSFSKLSRVTLSDDRLAMIPHISPLCQVLKKHFLAINYEHGDRAFSLCFYTLK